MKIIADNRIPFLEGVLEPFAEVKYLTGNLITRQDLKDADALLVRTRTQCNQSLLSGTSVKFIGSATIGFDHIDTHWCEENGIFWTNAPGCNADSVEQYVSAALLYWARAQSTDLSQLTIGIVGVGNVGSRVAKTCELLGMRVLLNDPPRQRTEGKALFTDLNAIAEQCDIISFHVPLNRSGADKTFHLVSDSLLDKIKNGVLLLNTCRGEVFDTPAILRFIHLGRILPPIVDCWEKEPNISLSLLDRAFIGTPHIAGYSQDGKANGTQQIVRALSNYFQLPLGEWKPANIPLPEHPEIEKFSGKTDQEFLSDIILHTYPIWEDDERLRKDPFAFESLRGNYPVRREYKAFTVKDQMLNANQKKLLKRLNFGNYKTEK